MYFVWVIGMSHILNYHSSYYKCYANFESTTQVPDKYRYK